MKAYLVIFGASDTCFGRAYTNKQKALEDTNETQYMIWDCSWSLEEEDTITNETIEKYMDCVKKELIDQAHKHGYNEIEIVEERNFELC